MLSLIASPIAKYAIIGLVIAGLVGYFQYRHVSDERAIAEGLAKISSITATNNELTAVHENDQAAIQELQKAKDVAEKATEAAAASQQVITKTVTIIKDRIVHAKANDACLALDDRDSTAYSGVLSIIGSSPTTTNPNQSGQSNATSNSIAGHPTTNNSKSTSHP